MSPKTLYLLLALFGRVRCQEGFVLEGSSQDGNFKPSVAIFEFHGVTSAARSFDVLPHGAGAVKLGREQAILVVGDAVLTPFWPEGTGANRALYSAVQSVWNLMEWHAESSSLATVKAKADTRFQALQRSVETQCTSVDYRRHIKDGYAAVSAAQIMEM